jgi:hypothetical protein
MTGETGDAFAGAMPIETARRGTGQLRRLHRAICRANRLSCFTEGETCRAPTALAFIRGFSRRAASGPLGKGLRSLAWKTLIGPGLRPLLLILAIYLAVGALYAIYIPPWQVPDEPAHYNYIAQVAQEGCCPVIAPGDYDQAYLGQLTSSGFPEGADLSAIEYEDWQPPAYYLAALPVFALSDGSLLALRLFSVALGAIVVALAYLTVLRLLPDHRAIAIGAALFVGFVPQHIAMMAGVNNDSFSELILGLTLLVLVAYLGGIRRPHAAMLGVLVGAAFLTKISAYYAAVLVALAVLWRWRAEKRPFRWLLVQVAWTGGLAVLIGLAWWARDVTVYGWPDFLGWRAHGAVVADQPRTADWIAASGLGSHLRFLVTTTFHSFWGQFGWMGVPMPERDYMALSVFVYWVLAGLALLPWKACRLAPWQRTGLRLLAALLLLTAIGYGFYNWTFVQAQGRYLFPAITAFGLLAAGGAYGWAAWLDRRFGWRLAGWLPVLALAWLPLYDLWALFRYIIPNLE